MRTEQIDTEWEELHLLLHESSGSAYDDIRRRLKTSIGKKIRIIPRYALPLEVSEVRLIIRKIAETDGIRGDVEEIQCLDGIFGRSEKFETIFPFLPEGPKG